MDTVKITDSYEGDELSFEVTVNENGVSGSPKDLTGATVECNAVMGGVTIAADTVELAVAASGTINVVFQEDSLTRGRWRIQVRATISNETQTVFDGVHQVLNSNF